ncbi:MAG: transglycosylase domain-containing protein [Oscillospiraceae bacterium]|nr:transglycosylase domain-containing protein [Oscillospiraceae bacterium]
MADKKKKKKAPRQEWKPNWFLSLLYKLWMLAFSVFKIALGAVGTVLVILFVCGIVFAGILGDYLQEDIIPNAYVDEESYSWNLNSYIYYTDSDGNIQKLQDIHADDNREWADYKDIPEDLIHATVAIEDKRFYEHQGVDWVTTVKACAGMFFGTSDAGGSTITQQLIKNLTGDNSVTVQRKVQEIFKAAQFEKNYDKEVILEMYLNRIYLGQRCSGVRTAAAKYFGKELEQLNLAECASLISITNNPSIYDPYGRSFEFRDYGEISGYERNKIRKEATLGQMLEQEWITQEEYDEAMAYEIVLKDGVDFEESMAECEAEGCDYRGLVNTFRLDGSIYYCPQCGAATTISENASQTVYSWYVDTVLEDVAKELAEMDGVEWGSKEVRETYLDKISRGGYHIYTCYDEDVQAQVDKIYTDLSQIPKTKGSQQLQSGIVIVDNSTGDIVAMAGGVDEKTVHDGFNCATDAKRQSGSSIKPLTVYAPAFEVGAVSPATVVKDLPYTYYGNTPWPQNVNKKYAFSSTVFNGVTQSVNGVAVHTLDMIGCSYSFSFAKDKFGLSTLIESQTASNGQIESDIDFSPLAMGAQTIGVTVRDMTAAYATFANGGVYREARTYTRVYDSDGNLVIDNTQDSRKILSQKTVDYMNYCLENVVMAGTGTAANFKGADIYGKTGSTTSNKDRWFCGYTNYYTAAVWCGYLIPEEIVLSGSSQNPACVLFRKVMQPLHTGLKNISLLKTNKLRSVTVCLDSGKIATEACTHDVRNEDGFVRTQTVLAYREDMPATTCQKHVLVEYCTSGGGVANEYCKQFAQAGQIELVEKSLVKLTQKDIDEMVKAGSLNPKEKYLSDSYIYLVNENGTDGKFKGIYKNANKDVNAPYIVCTEHTKESWEAYQQSLLPTEPEVEDPLLPWWPFSE